MIDWVDVLRRLMVVYNVHTQNELSMAMGVQVKVGLVQDIMATGIPWRILERAVEDKKVSWNWLLAGKESMPNDGAQCDAKSVPGRLGCNAKRAEPPANAKTDGDKNNQPARKATAGEDAFDQEMQQARNAPPRIETRELERQLLDNEPEQPDENVNNSQTPANSPGQAGSSSNQTNQPDTVVRELKEIKAKMQREIEKVDELLDKRTQP
ncbi:MAG: hypothetical protein LIP23_03890 [Planctomycetes bacterium]|nr:hypothetical protein [Planctomycetota bacterium]